MNASAGEQRRRPLSGAAVGGGWYILPALLALGVAIAGLWLYPVPEVDAARSFAWRAVLAGTLQLAAVVLVWRRRDRAAMVLVIGLGLVFRVAAFGWAPVLSSDLHRYVWDGAVQEAGYSPYAAPPSDPRLTHLRDEAIWPTINRPDAVTVYPPGAQLAFLTLARLGLGSVTGVRAAAGAAELLALALLILALRRRNELSAGRVALYAWCPLIVSEVWISGHLDALVLPLMMGALLLAEKRRGGWAGVLLGAATLLKLYPGLLLFALPKKVRRPALAAAAGVVAVLYVPYTIMAGRGVLGFLPDYIRVGEDFNAGLRGFLQQALAWTGSAARPLAMGLCAAGLAAVCTHLYRRAMPDAQAAGRTARDVALAFVLLLPTAVHPWYAAWLVPLLALSPAAAGVWIVTLLPLSYLKYGAPGGLMPAWVPLAEWIPALLLVVAQFMPRLRGWERRWEGKPA